jgi:hypothetical protein
MARNLSLITVPVDEVIDGVNVIYAGTLDDALFGPNSHLVDFEVRSAATKAWITRHGGHYYAEEKWAFDEDDRMYPAFSVKKGVREAKRIGARLVVVENLS